MLVGFDRYWVTMRKGSFGSLVFILRVFSPKFLILVALFSFFWSSFVICLNVIPEKDPAALNAKFFIVFGGCGIFCSQFVLHT